MSVLPTVAIAGATGNLGVKVTEGFLQQPFRDRFHDIIVLARSRSPKAENLVKHGASLRLYAEENLQEALTGVDVLINTVGPSGHHFKEALLRSIPGSGVKLYFPSEFGVDHYVHDFSHEEWDAKKAHFQLASELIPNISMCRVYAGLFLEDSIGPWFGFDTKRGRYEAIGDPSQKTSYTSMYDVGKALAILASQPVGTIPSEVHLSGDSKSMNEIAEIMEANGADRIQVTSVPLESYKTSALAKPSPTPERCLRFLMGEGKIWHSVDGIGNQSDIVQVTGGLSTWMSMSQLAKDISGRPWAEAEWEPVN
ncbi:Isoflavone reductase-like protein TP7 [Fusarium oxysporum f. sp. cubense]|uniref:Isoflavone reductase-like protein TP7 n=1 Tax=Fusarium oxysporum f. sp. cubense TaxID=61366 RepID=A0A559L382_FUSOC|nr:Isoflavone reductase-like protein TP7 [Fusarium oxysporum f. sp. cubense]